MSTNAISAATARSRAARRNRNCPKCRGQALARWLEQRAAELLPAEYFHVDFNLPQLVAPLDTAEPAIVYGLLVNWLKRLAETEWVIKLLEVTGDARLGQTALATHRSEAL